MRFCRNSDDFLVKFRPHPDSGGGGEVVGNLPANLLYQKIILFARRIWILQIVGTPTILPKKNHCRV
ncbi:hypothetical protein EHQ76_18050 [Leptospira barantonii]|uniref:Uncharacterized protein n=1 Tax=Leptospira barantonii TaxID=2023184 RepID=A0A5F2AYG1_9LEPT|nr:hypothetical protein EHQ76_18050 [Leptospira barantonii]